MSPPFYNSILSLIIFISQTSAQNTISCDETRTGFRTPQQQVSFDFVASKPYTQVYLEGCESRHDIWLQIIDSYGNVVADADDGNDHGIDQDQCKDQYAGDITIPESVDPGQRYTFIVKGFKNAFGLFSVTLHCDDEATDTTTTSNPPLTSTTTTTSSSIEAPTSATTAIPTYSPTSTTTTSTIETITESPTPECHRHREPWHLTSEANRKLYINGFKQLAFEGKMKVFTQTHSSTAQHSNAAFLPWHRYFIWELETQFRNLGPEYECFAIPFWDWTYEIENDDNSFDIKEWHILNSGLGGDGNEDNHYCVDRDGWDEYRPYYDDNDGNCLRRKVCDPHINSNKCYFGGSATILQSLLTEENAYGDDDKDNDYRYRFELKHGSAHVRIGGLVDDDGGHLGNLQKSTDDPIFFLLHSFVDFQYALWQDCRDHDQVDNDDITELMYNGTEIGCRLDDTLDFSYLEQQEWSYVYHVADGITIRDMHNIEDWDVSYDKGDYFDRAKVDQSICVGNINSLWFDDVVARRRLYEMDVTDHREYTNQIFEGLNKKLGGCDKSGDERQKKELFKTWAQMDCQYLTIGSNCERPKYFDDCSDMEMNRYIKCNGQVDIDITLEELIEKVEDYPCMVETRQTYYKWAKQIGNLYGLCRGDYDTFCDRDFITKESGEAKCVANQKKKISKESGEIKVEKNMSY